MHTTGTAVVMTDALLRITSGGRQSAVLTKEAIYDRLKMVYSI